MYRFNGNILRDTREAFGLSSRDLSAKLSISEQDILNYEDNLVNPPFTVLTKLNNLFDVELSYFQRNGNGECSFDMRQIAFRTTFKNSIHKTGYEVAYLNLVSNFYTQVMSGLSLPKERITVLRDRVRRALFEKVTINELGHMVREALEIDESNKKLIPIIERSGVLIVEREMQDDIDAYSGWSNDGLPIIVLGSSKKVAARRNFDVAHELGHLLMHYRKDISSLDNISYSILEKQADQFAAALLLDKEKFKIDYKVINDKTDPNNYIVLKHKYNVSVQSIAMRASDLGLMNNQEKQYFWINIQKKHYKKNEPLDKQLTITGPGKLRAMLNMRIKCGLPSIFEIWGIRKDFVELFGISTNLLLQSEVSSNIENKVIHFNLNKQG